jgi:mannitol-specific phosphotransferase system IIBC component
MMCVKLISSFFTTKSHKESLSPTFLFLALVTTPSPDNNMVLCVFLRVFFSLVLVVILFKNSKAQKKTEEKSIKNAQEKGSVAHEDTILR